MLQRLFFAVLPLCVAGLLAGGLGQEAQGQGFTEFEETRSNVAYFYHARPGEATIQVSVWGTVGKTGVYEIPDGTDLDRLLTMTGGAPVQPRSERQRRTITLQIWRTSNEGERSVVYEAELEKLLGQPGAYPVLRDQDVLVVETVTDSKFSWREALQIASSLGTFALLMLRLFDRPS